MPAGIQFAIALLTALMPLAQQALELIKQANTENRDLTDDEMNALAAATDALYAVTQQKLQGAAAGG
jgi:hypothetical protein